MLTSTQTIKWTCDACGKVEGPGEIVLPTQCKAMQPCLPAGWVYIGHMTYCPSHCIAVSVDDGEAFHISNINGHATKRI
jgi:hypothetical protein